jgi:hypothetical protein
MTTLREAAQQALEALEWHYRQGHSDTLGGLRLKIDEKVLRSLCAALAEPDITITGTYEEFIEFVRMACMHETIYEDSEGRDILVIRMLDAYGMAHSWALEHTRNNLS